MELIEKNHRIYSNKLHSSKNYVCFIANTDIDKMWGKLQAVSRQLQIK